jgi:DNA-binding CsgD family transcriptional regulator
VFAHPFPFLSFVVTRWKSTLYRHMAVPSVERLDDDRVRWMQTIPVPHRPCLAFHHFTIARVKVLPCHLGLPEATLESAALSPRSAELVFSLPTAPPSSARGTRAAPPPMVAAQLDEAYAKVAAALRANGEKGEPGASAAPATSSLAGDWSDRFRLSPRQRAVFALLLEGRANKDIAGVLACSERNVEFHVGRILRAAGVASRAELLAKVLGERPAT